MCTSAVPSFHAGRADLPAASSMTAAFGYSAAHSTAFNCEHTEDTAGLRSLHLGESAARFWPLQPSLTLWFSSEICSLCQECPFYPFFPIHYQMS